MIFDRIFKLGDKQTLSIMLINILVKFLVHSLERMLVRIYQLLLIVLYYSAHFLSKLIFYLSTHIILNILSLLFPFLIGLRPWSYQIFLNFLIVNNWILLFLWALLFLIFVITHIKLFIWKRKIFIINLLIESSIGRNKSLEHKIIKGSPINSLILRIQVVIKFKLNH